MTRLGRRWQGLSLLVLTLLLVVAWARAEEKTMKLRAIRHITKLEWVKVGDVQGHVMGVSERSGLAFLDNGEVATTTTRATFDVIKGAGSHQGYALYTFKDGSTMVNKFQGTQTTAKGGKTGAFQGTFEYTDGSGRFTGIKGSGTYTGERLLPSSDGGDYVIDVVGTYTLPSQ